ncbi:hypothetical protein L2E82_48682 [Cichorium intybus]|uniref:Uncharacterized protein n=1 Tax=Cichorium intybus TaxID=13427 RepID=A0ACB8YYH0_CICIN|nr:hypothetical protein L2E82_48682 [Cichorium intybus]
MKALQKLIRNSNKMDKASMLDEAIEYLKQLQLQVQNTKVMEGGVLAITDNVVVPFNEVISVVRIVKKEAFEEINSLIITRAASLSTFLSLPFDNHK